MPTDGHETQRRTLVHKDETTKGQGGTGSSPSASDAEVAPRLPERAPIVEFARARIVSDDVPDAVRAVASPSRGTLTPFGVDPGTQTIAWKDYEEPEVGRTRWLSVGVLATRVIAVLWAAWTVLAARTIQTDGLTADRSDAVLTRGLFGFVVAVLMAIAGIAWADRRTHNIHRLDGRLPSRVRCYTAWLVPVVVVVLASLLVLYVPATQPADIRPLVATVAFLIVLWRPYSLVRRMLASLTPATSNPLIGASFALDIAGLGVMWWQLLAWSNADRVGVQRAEVMVAIGSVSVLSLLANVAAWTLILLALRRAQQYRQRALRTRHTHRMLRLQGIDPLDADVWWAMVHGRLGQVTPHAPSEPTAPSPAEVEVPTSPDPWSYDVRSRDARADGEREVDTAVGHGAREDDPEVADLRRKLSEALDAASGGDERALDRAARLEDVLADDALLERLLRSPDDIVDVVDDERVAEWAEDEDVDEVAAEWAEDEDVDEVDAEWAEDEDVDEVDAEWAEDADDELRAELAGEPVREVWVGNEEWYDDEWLGADEPLPEEPLPQPARIRLFALDLARLLIVVCLGAATIASLALLDQAIRATTGDDLTDRLDRMNDLRFVFVVSFAAAGAVTPIWLGVAGRHVRRLGIDDVGVRRWLAATVVGVACAVALAVLGQEVSEAVAIVLIEIPAALGTLACVMAVRLERSLELRTVAHLVWAISTPTVFVVLVSARMVRPFDADLSLVPMMFFAALLAVVWFVLIVIIALSTREFQHELRRVSARLPHEEIR